MNKEGVDLQPIKYFLDKYHKKESFLHVIYTPYDMYGASSLFYALLFQDSISLIWKPQGYNFIYLNLNKNEVLELQISKSFIYNRLNIVSKNRVFYVLVDFKDLKKLEDFCQVWLKHHPQTPYSVLFESI